MKPGRATGVFSLGLANGLSLLAAAGAAAAYARELSAVEFAHWAGAMATARACLLLLDGGLKTALVRRAAWPDRRTLARLRWLSLGLALLLTAAVGGTVSSAWLLDRLGGSDAALWGVYVAAYLLPYPPLFGALARLERAASFGAIGRAEGLSTAVEFALPAAFIALGQPCWLAFALSVTTARCLRSAWIVQAAARVPTQAGASDDNRDDNGDGGARALLREGAGVQAIAGIAMLRDQMPLWLLAPWFGAGWAGLYTFANTACALATQTFVQTASRVALPRLRQADAKQQPAMTLDAIRALALHVLPPLALLPAWLTRADAWLWDGRWHDALQLLPWIALRMVGGVATTLVGAWLLVAQPPWLVARTHAAWTAVEVGAALLALALWGPRGLALAGAATAWAGVWLFLRRAAPAEAAGPRFVAILEALLLHPALWVALAMAVWAQFQPGALAAATAVTAAGWVGEQWMQWRRPRWRKRHDPA